MTIPSDKATTKGKRPVYDGSNPAPANGRKPGNPRNSATLQRHNADPGARAKAKAIFLLTFRRPASVLAASEAAGVDRTTIFRWRQQDLDFDQLYRDAREDGTDVIKDVVYGQALGGNLTACSMVLKWRGAFPGDLHWEGGEDQGRKPDFTVEELAQRAIDRGYITAPRTLKEIDGEA